MLVVKTGSIRPVVSSVPAFSKAHLSKCRRLASEVRLNTRPLGCPCCPLKDVMT